MKKIATLALVALTTLALSTAAFAQDAGDAGIFADAAGTQTTLALANFVPSNFYVVGFDLAGDVKGWEAGVSISDPSLLVLSTVLDQGSSLNIGGVGNFIVGSGGCFPGAGAYVMVTYQIGNFTPNAVSDVIVCMGPTSPSSFSPARPGWLKCDGSLGGFGVAENGEPDYPNGCMVINNTNDAPVSNVDASFGAVKAQF